MPSASQEEILAELLSGIPQASVEADRRQQLPAAAAPAPAAQLLAQSQPVTNVLIQSMERRGASREQILAELRENLEFLQIAAPFQSEFRNLVAGDSNVTGRMLDIGCGPRLAPPMRYLARVVSQIDGVDYSDEVERHPHLTLRWRGAFEAAPIPESAYDIAVAYNVIEHVERARPFFEKVARILKPGGSFWALSPNANHPFAWMSRTLEVIGIKAILARENKDVNSYSAYYRLNCRRHIVKAIGDLGFGEPELFHFARPGWEIGYFPRFLRWAPHLYDAALGNRIPSLRLLVGVHLKRRG